jgi:hypothetical protein
MRNAEKPHVAQVALCKLGIDESAVVYLKLGLAVAPLKLECLEWLKHRENWYNNYMFFFNSFCKAIITNPPTKMPNRA